MKKQYAILIILLAGIIQVGCDVFRSESEEDKFGGMGGNWIRLDSSSSENRYYLRIEADSILIGDVAVSQGVILGTFCRIIYINPDFDAGYHAETGQLSAEGWLWTCPKKVESKLSK